MVFSGAKAYIKGMSKFSKNAVTPQGKLFTTPSL